MSKGARTKEQVVERAAALFNQLGYQAASISDVMAATGLQKGGIYRHFQNKDELALAAFDFAVERMAERFREALAGHCSAPERLRAVLSVYQRLPVDPPVPGGCPLLNAAVEADDAYPALRERAKVALGGLKRLLREILRDGIARAELRADINVDGTVHVMVASLEGAVMMCKLSGNQQSMRYLAEHWDAWLVSLSND
ncbi:MAG TPA: TetR/AcrR family transcriptional regulator [Polyangiales bacterium]|nr:TetR/AcrR family transcriptional regulator [Polyangiales bacterium]